MAKHPDSRSQISRYGWMQPMYMRIVSFWKKFTFGSRIRASRSDLLKLPNITTTTTTTAAAAAAAATYFRLNFSLCCDSDKELTD